MVSDVHFKNMSDLFSEQEIESISVRMRSGTVIDKTEARITRYMPVYIYK